MYIKQVIIQGFKSYRDQTAVEPFSSRHNVIVGRNGSGKSNFFSAVQFVLSDEFSHMSPEERQQLLHEGTGARVVSAFVEIIFDNSDHRLPIEKDEVSLRRDVGAKKDTYYLEKRQVTRSDVMNLLETAGFSKSNPYYIVKQGKITQLATAVDAFRLKLLREVAGTRVYDEKREESRGALQEAEAKRNQILELLESIEERLNDLEEEKEELKEYQKWDKMHRSLEYTIHEKELRETRGKIDDLTDQHDNAFQKSRELHKNVTEAQARIETLESELSEVGVKLTTVQNEKGQFEEELKDLIKTRAKMEMDIRDLEKRVTEDESATTSGTEELKMLAEQIERKTRDLKRVSSEYSELKSKQDQCSRNLRVCEQRRTELYAKQGRGQQFRSKEERDSWIKKEAKVLSNELASKERERSTVSNAVDELRTKIQQKRRSEQERGSNLDVRRQDVEKAGREYSQLKLQRDELSNERKELWRRDAAIAQSIQATKDELHKWEKALRGTMSKATGKGLESLNRIVDEKSIQGVYGPLIQLVSCHPRYFTAIEVTAGNKLFQVVVDNEHVASRIMTIMNKEKLPGEITFLPLSILKSSSVQYPDTEEAVPLISKLQYNSMFDSAAKRVFGKTLVCRTLETASQLAKSDDLDCVTLEGDQVSRRGALTGGYHDMRKSRMEAWRHVDEQKQKMLTEEREKEDIAQKVNDLDGRITHIVSEMERLESRRVNFKETYEKQRVDVMSITRELSHMETSLKQKERSLEQLESEVQSLQGTLASLQSELGGEIHSQLDPSDQREVEQLNDQIHHLQQELRALLDKLNDLEPKKNMLETLLKDNLEQRRDEVKKVWNLLTLFEE
jgi:structural maintenance of chromosome 3 (chondroitin sulfate proteoglycan 6)